MKLKDLLGISLVSVFLFPVILIAIMLAAGVVHLEFGNGKDKERMKQAYSGDEQARQEESEAKELKAYKALELKQKELADQEAQVNLETERLENLKMETVKAKEEIEGHRKKIEEMVGKSAEAQDKQIASLAEVYGGMRPDEAAPILLSLDNSMVVRIMRKIPETRATSKLMAALAALDVKRAATITTLLGGKGKTQAETDAGQPKTEPAVNKPATPAAKPADAAKGATGTDQKPAKTPDAKKDGAGGKA